MKFHTHLNMTGRRMAGVFVCIVTLHSMSGPTSDQGTQPLANIFHRNTFSQNLKCIVKDCIFGLTINFMT